MQLDKAIGFKKSIQLFEEDHSMPMPRELMGVEIEVEGMRSRPAPPPLWREVGDDSLRNNGTEYVFSGPLYGTGVTDALMDMSLFLEEHKPTVGYRTSVHVHLNVSDMDVEQLLTLITLYLIFERTIVKYHGSHREENIFCVPFYKAPDTLDALRWLFRDVKDNSLHSGSVSDRLSMFNKYNALNIGAVMVHGSLEFRHMSGTTDMLKVFEWIKIVQHLKRASLSGEIDYMALINSASGSTSTLLDEVFRECADSMRYPDMTNDIMYGARLAQRVVRGSDMSSTSQTAVEGVRRSKAVTDKINKLREGMLLPVSDGEVVVDTGEVEEMIGLGLRNTVWNTPPTPARPAPTATEIDDFISFLDEANIDTTSE